LSELWPVKNAWRQRGQRLYVVRNAITAKIAKHAKLKISTAAAESANVAKIPTTGTIEKKHAIISLRRRRIALNSDKNSAEFIT